MCSVRRHRLSFSYITSLTSQTCTTSKRMAAVAVREAEEGRQVEIDRLQQALDRKDRLAIAAAMEVDEQHKLEVHVGACDCSAACRVYSISMGVVYTDDQSEAS